MNKIIAVNVGIVIGLVGSYIHTKISNRNRVIKRTKTKPVKETKTSNKETKETTVSVVTETEKKVTTTNLEEEEVVEKEAKDKTVTETISDYTNSGNLLMVIKVQQTMEYMRSNDIYHDPKDNEQDEEKTISELCYIMSKKNNEIKEMYQKELNVMKNAILIKSTRKHTKLVHLPESLKGIQSSDNIAFVRTVKLSHINEAIARIDRITKRYINCSMKIQEKDYFVLLFNLTKMNKELVKIGPLLPTINNVYPSVNVIAEDKFNMNKEAFYKYLKSTMSEKEYLFCTKYDKSLTFDEKENNEI